LTGGGKQGNFAAVPTPEKRTIGIASAEPSSDFLGISRSLTEALVKTRLLVYGGAIVALVVAAVVISYLFREHEGGGPPPAGTNLTAQHLEELTDSDATVRRKAAEALGRVQGADADAAVAPLVGALGDPDSAVRRAATDALGSLGRPAVEPLIAAFKSKDDAIRRQAAIALGQVGARHGSVAAAASPVLRAALKEDNPGVRLAAALALRRVPGPRDDMDPPVFGGKEFAETWERIVWHGTTSSEDSVVIPPLIEGLKDEEVILRVWSAEELASLYIVRAVETAVPPLETALRDQSAEVGSAAAEALMRLGERLPAAVKVLLNALADPDEKVRVRAARALDYGVIRIGGDDDEGVGRRLPEAPTSLVTPEAVAAL
jgi:HEAT repeat protein